MAKLDFNINMRDLAVVEILQSTAAKDIAAAMEQVRLEFGKINVESDGIAESLKIQAREYSNLADNMAVSINQWKSAVEDRKQEIIKNENDRASFDTAIVSAQAQVADDLQAITVAKSKETGNIYKV